MKSNRINDLWNEQLRRLCSFDEYVEFISFAARFPKYDFSEALLIYAQRPDATMVADMRTWNKKINRWIKRGSQAISIFNNAYIRHNLFDISDTYGSKIPKQWHMNNAMAAAITEHTGSSDFVSAVTDIAYQAVDARMDRIFESFCQLNSAMFDINDKNIISNIYHKFLENIGEYYCLKRCQLNSDYPIDLSQKAESFRYEFEAFSQNQEMMRLTGIHCVEIGSAAVAELENLMRTIIEERRNTHETGLQNRRERDENPDNRNAGRNIEHRQVRQSVAAVDRGVLPGHSTIYENVNELEQHGSTGGDRSNEVSYRVEEHLREASSPAEHQRHNGNLSLETGNGDVDRTSGNDRDSIQAETISIDGSQSELYNKLAKLFPEIITGEFSEIEITSGMYKPLFLSFNSSDNELTLTHYDGEGLKNPEMILSINNVSQSAYVVFYSDELIGYTESCSESNTRLNNTASELIENIEKWNYTAQTTETVENIEIAVDVKASAKSLKILMSPVGMAAYPTEISPECVEEQLKNLIGINLKHIEYDNYCVIYSEESENQNADSESRFINSDMSLKGCFAVIGYKNGQYKSLSKKQIKDFENKLSETEYRHIEPLETKSDYEEYQISLFEEANEKEPELTSSKEIIKTVSDQITSDTSEDIAAELEKVRDLQKAEINISHNNRIDYVLSADDLVHGGPKAKYKSNVTAIKLLKQIELEERLATAEEQKIISAYSGWGGTAEAFNPKNEAWSKEYTELKELLSEDEYEAARASVLTSFYTPSEITSAVNNTISRLGFSGGNILEPSMGTGAFFSTLEPEIKTHSHLYGVEIDSLTSRIAKQLYQTATIQNTGFEKTTYNDASFDVIFGNVPFGEFSVSDSRYDRYNFYIHDYFFAKAVDKLKPGGILAFVTSTGTLDKSTSKLRTYIAERAELIGAVRLPEGSIPGTKVVSDIILLQKRESIATELPLWINTGYTQEGYRINQYYINHPQMLLGELKPDTRFGRKEDCTLIQNGNTIEQLNTMLQSLRLPFEIVAPTKKQIEKKDTIPSDPNVRNFTHTIVNGDLYFKENSEMIKVNETGVRLERMLGMHKIRIALRELIEAQYNNCSDEQLKKHQERLNDYYDNFVKKFGYISSAPNESVFGCDDDYNLIFSLENKNTENGEVTKTEIFSKRTIRPVKPITNAENAVEALNISLDQKGKVDIAYMSQLYGNTPPEKMLKELNGIVFLNPAKAKDGTLEGYEEAGEYLSGDVREKLRIAEYAAENNDQYKVNVEALKKVIPEDIQPGDITVHLGMTWIDIEDYEQFLYDTFHTPIYLRRPSQANIGYRVCIYIERNSYTGEWKVRNKTVDGSHTVTSTFGSTRMSAYEITEQLLNQRDIVIKDRSYDDDKVKYTINNKETQIAINNAKKIKAEFEKWLWETPERRNKYVTRYNNLYNSLRGRDYSNIKLSYPQMSPAIRLKPHQEAAVARAVFNGNTLLAHCVGAGKTFEMAAATMEKKRLGLITKACVVVPKHLTLQMAREWQQLYPTAKLLVATPKDFEKDNRRRFISRIVTGDYDAVIMSFQQFEKIKMSYDYRKRFLKEQIQQVIDCINETDSNSMTIKQLERIKKQMEERLNKLLNESHKDEILEFEKLGFDSLVVDEAHYYKNCFVQTRMSNVSGVSVTPAQKSEDMLMKTQYLNDKTGYKGIIFATGTPVSNTMVELYIMQRYLRPDILKKAGCFAFDDWAASYGEVVKQLELKPAGDGYRMKSRFAKFVNLPELMAMYKEFADIVTADMIDLPVPSIKGGKPRVIVAKPSDYQKDVMQQLAERSEAIHNGCDPTIDNMLKVTNDARLLGLDGRAYDPTAENFPESKVNRCIEEAIRIYKNTAEQKGVQIIWSDIAVNDDKGFSVYNYIRDELINRGIPSNQISLIGDVKTDKKRAELFAQLRSGDKRFVLASTTKLGTGANIQTRLAAEHHLDIPWRPSDLEQRNGRIIRQFNSFDEVEIIHYTTEQTFDTYMLNTVTTKQKFISQIMTSKSPARTMEDVDEMVLTYSEMQALTSGNPLIKEKIEIDNEIARLSLLESEYLNKRYRLQDLISVKLPERIEAYKSMVAKSDEDIIVYKSNIDKEFSIVIDGKMYDDRKIAGDRLEKLITQCELFDEDVVAGEYNGFKIILSAEKQTSLLGGESKHIEAALCGKLRYYTTVMSNNNLGNIQRIVNLFSDKITEKAKLLYNQLDSAIKDLEAAKHEILEPFAEAEELKKLRERITVVNAELDVGGGTEQTVEQIETEIAPEI